VYHIEIRDGTSIRRAFSHIDLKVIHDRVIFLASCGVFSRIVQEDKNAQE